jgi:DNA repair exonuclease SbcCD ATPase subunit
LKLKSVTVKNFLSIREATIELSGQGLVLVKGQNLDSPAFDSNGAGKSTTFEAVVYSLFEKTVKGLSANDIINEEVGNNTSVILDFDGSDGKEYRIARYRKHKEHKNNTRIFQEGKNITPKSSKDCNKLIEEIIGMDFITFTNSIFFGQGLIKKFALATDSEKKGILEKMMQMDVWSKCLEIAKSKRDKADKQLVSLENKVQSSKNLLSEIEDTIDSLKNAEKEEEVRTKEEIAELKKELKEAQKRYKKELAELATDYEEAKEEYVKFASDSTDNVDKLEAFEKLKDKINKSLHKFDDIEDAISERKADIKMKERECKSIAKSIEKLKEELEDIRSGVGTNCPVCKQEIKKSSIKESMLHVAMKIKEEDERFDKINEEAEELQGEVKTLQKALKKKEPLEEQKETVMGEIFQLKSFIKTEEKAEEKAKRNVDRLEKAIEDLGEQREIKRIKKDITRKEEQGAQKYQQLIEQKEAQKAELISGMDSSQNEISKLRERVDKLKFAVVAYGNGGIKSHLLDAVTPFLNERTNYYLGKLAGNTIEVILSTQTTLASGEKREKFDIEIRNSVGGNTYEANSTGERGRIDLAISLALQDLVMSRSNSKFNILLYDEIFDGLDAIGCENVITLLKEIEKRVETIYVITHNEILKAFFDKELIVRKEGGRTTVTKEG